MNNAWTIEQLMVSEMPLAIGLAAIFEPQHLAAGIAEGRHHQIDITIPIQITRLNVGDPPDVIQQDMLGKMIALVLEQHHFASKLIPRENAAQYGHHNVKVSILIEVHDRGMSRALQVFRQDPFLELPISRLAIQDDGIPRIVTNENIIQT